MGATLTPWHDARSGGSTGSSSISAHALSPAGTRRYDDRQPQQSPDASVLLIV